MTSAELSNLSPEAIESEIAATRASLEHKMGELERRLDPRPQMRSLRQGIEARGPQLLAWTAVAAVATGAMLGVTGWRRRRRETDEMFVSGCVADRYVL